MNRLADRSDLDRIPKDVNLDANQTGKLDTCLKFLIDPQTLGLIKSESIQEVLTIAATHIMPVPNKPSCILGIFSHRGHVYWAIDLSMLMGLMPLEQNIELYEAIFTVGEGLSLALIVPRIFGVVHIPSDRFESNMDVIPTPLSPFLKGYIKENYTNSAGEISYLLQVENILRSAILHS